MADEKNKVVTDAPGPDAGPAPVQPGTPDKAADIPGEQKATSVSVFNFSEIMAEKKATEKAAAKQEEKASEKPKEKTKTVEKAAPAKEGGPRYRSAWPRLA